MQDNDQIALARIRFDNALRCIKSSKLLISDEDYKSAANRSYYAVFYAIRAVLALDGIDYKKHSAVISHFRKEYIKTGIFDTSLSEVLSELFDIRTDSDYDDFFIISKEEVIRQIRNAETFVELVRAYLLNRFKQ
ncbi:MAG TPA: HEPN domain-containing protein [Spirochaetota bacterium]|nr:HEPN domain-containing protein [Spirochaetota bacterium]